MAAIELGADDAKVSPAAPNPASPKEVKAFFDLLPFETGFIWDIAASFNL
jgi:hypothetical protein